VAHPDLDRLLDFSLRFAQDMLKKRGTFYPFAATVQTDGELKPLAIHSGTETPQPRALLDQFSEVLKNLARNGEALATALCFDGLVSSEGDEKRKKDAIAVALEHSNGESAVVYLPYSKKFFGGYSYAPLIAIAGERKYFP
jgi:hypothetical protein